MKSELCFGIFIALVFGTFGQMSRSKIDVQEEINKIAQKFEKFEKPSPEMVDSFIVQIRESCRTNRTLEPDVMTNMSTCVERLFNQTELQSDIETAIPNGSLDNVFRNICRKWPSVKTCIKDGINYVEECWEQGHQITVALDSMVGFFCEQDNSGARIALFFAEGGLTCLETHGDEVRNCVNEHINEESNDLCASVGQIHSCLTPLRKCQDVTPENLISSMVRQMGKSLNCAPLPDPYGRRTNGASTHQMLSMSSTLILASLFV